MRFKLLVLFALAAFLFPIMPSTSAEIRPVPTGLNADEIGVLGHSNVGTFILSYRTRSTYDRLTAIRHGGYDIKVWGNPLDRDYARAWSKVTAAQPPGGYRAMWVMMGFKTYREDLATQQGWVDHIYQKIITDYPTVEYIWWSPMNTYFAVNPGDLDAASLLTLDPWGTNPEGLTTWKASDIESELSWNSVLYAYSQGYFDDFGPWINLTDAQTATDSRHPTTTPREQPTLCGQTHGGDILISFFDTLAAAVGSPAISSPSLQPCGA